MSTNHEDLVTHDVEQGGWVPSCSCGWVGGLHDNPLPASEERFEHLASVETDDDTDE